METVRSVVASLCVSFIFFGVIMMLVPSGTMQKNIKTFMSIAIVSVIVAVISGVSVNIRDTDLKFNSENCSEMAADLNSKINELNIETTENTVKQLIAERLTALGVNSFNLTVNADILNDTGISITEINIICDQGDGAVCKNVLTQLGLNGTVTER